MVLNIGVEYQSMRSKSASEVDGVVLFCALAMDFFVGRWMRTPDILFFLQNFVSTVFARLNSVLLSDSHVSDRKSRLVRSHTFLARLMIAISEAPESGCHSHMSSTLGARVVSHPRRVSLWLKAIDVRAQMEWANAVISTAEMESHATVTKIAGATGAVLEEFCVLVRWLLCPSILMSNTGFSVMASPVLDSMVR